jgi:hypothetical protein
MKKNLRRNWDPSYGFLSPQPRNRNTARGQDWGRAGGEGGTASPAPSSYSDRCSPSISARSAALPDWNRNLVGRESHIPLLLTSNIVHRQQLRNGGVGAAEASHSWHRGGVPATATDNDCNRNGDSNLNCRVSSADPNRNIYRAGGGGGEGDNTLRFSTASNRLVSDVEENYYQTIRTPQSDKKVGAQQPRPLPHHHRHQQVQLSDVYQSVISSPDKSTVSSSGRLSSDYQAVSLSSPLAAARGQQQQQRLFASPRRKDGPTPLAHSSNIPVLLNRPWTAAPASASGSSSVAASPRRAATAGEQRTIGGGVQPQQLEPSAVQRTRLTDGRIYGTGGSDKTTYNRGPPGMGCSYNPVNRNVYNLNTGRASLLASPSRYTDSFWGQCS